MLLQQKHSGLWKAPWAVVDTNPVFILSDIQPPASTTTFQADIAYTVLFYSPTDMFKKVA